MRRPSLLLTFGVLSLIPLVVLGLVLSTSLEGIIRKRAEADAVQATTVFAAVGVPAYVSAEGVERGLSHRQIDLLDTASEGGAGTYGLAGLEIRSPDGRIVFSDKRYLIGTGVPVTAEFRRVLSGEVLTRVGRARGTKVLAVSTPLRYPERSGSSGVVTLYVPYEAIAGNVARDTHKLYLILAGGLGLLWLLLLPVVARASRALRREAAEHEHLAHHDALTGLANRLLFTQRLEGALAGGRREDLPVTVMVLDVDRFKHLNDRLGHLDGDAVLKGVAERLAGSLRDTDTVARLGGDEFGILLIGAGRTGGELVARRIVDALAHPLTLDGKPVPVRASIGMAVSPDHGRDFDTLLRAADLAMYAAKETGGCYRIAGPTALPAAPERQAVGA